MSFRDLAALVNDSVLTTFGEPSSTPVTYAQIGSPDFVEVAGVFEAPGARIEIDAGVPVASTEPRLFVKLDAIGGEARKGDRWTAQGKTYEVTDASQLDGYGGVYLRGRLAR